MAKQELKKGNLLISEPFLGDDNFERSVVLICEHNEQGSFGFILNQNTTILLKDVWDEVTYGDFPVYIGGPVQKNTLHFVHKLGNKIINSVEIANGIFWSGDYEQVALMVNLGKIDEKDIRFFIGYSGWSSGQLEREIAANSWIVTVTDADFIFETEPQQFWRNILKKMGGKYKAISNYPIDPSMN